MNTIHQSDYKKLIEALKSLRKSKGITQISLAKRIKRDQTYVSKYESHDRRLDIIEVRNICRALGEDFSKFIEKFEHAIRR